MDRQFEMLRKKMERFNAWEAENRRGLSAENRLEQFVVLYDLGKMHCDETLKKMHENHLNDIISATGRFRKVKAIRNSGGEAGKKEAGEIIRKNKQKNKQAMDN